VDACENGKNAFGNLLLEAAESFQYSELLSEMLANVFDNNDA